MCLFFFRHNTVLPVSQCGGCYFVDAQSLKVIGWPLQAPGASTSGAESSAVEAGTEKSEVYSTNMTQSMGAGKENHQLEALTVLILVGPNGC